MKQSVVVAFLMAALCTGLTFAQSQPAQNHASSSSPSAFIYVTNNPSGNTYEINGYSVAADGTLTSIAGSPFHKTTNHLEAMANTSHWFFAADNAYIYSFSIASNGALKQVSSIDAAQFYAFGGDTGAALVLDHTGSTLYATAVDGSGDNEVQFFHKNSTTGALSYFGSTEPTVSGDDIHFIGNNQFAYGSDCPQLSPNIYGFVRSSDGTLTGLNRTTQVPDLPNGNYCTSLAAADPANDIAVALYPDFGDPRTNPPPQLAVYTADSAGNLTTNSTYQNMPSTAAGTGVFTLNDMKVSPAGNLLAVAGESGLQVFHFNGSNQITPYTGLLAVHPISQVFWDNHNHLYGISPSGLLYVFTVTPTGHKQAPGSPHALANPRGLAVLSK